MVRTNYISCAYKLLHMSTVLYFSTDMSTFSFVTNALSLSLNGVTCMRWSANHICIIYQWDARNWNTICSHWLPWPIVRRAQCLNTKRCQASNAKILSVSRHKVLCNFKSSNTLIDITLQMCTESYPRREESDSVDSVYTVHQWNNEHYNSVYLSITPRYMHE